MFDTFRQSARNWYEDRNEREQILIKVAGVVLPLVALSFVAVLFNQSLNSTRGAIETYEKTLRTLGDIAPTYQKSSGSESGNSADKFSPEALENNDIKMTSFVATHATAVGIQVDSYDEQERRIGGGDDEGGAALNKLSVDVEIREAPVEKFMKLLERIEQADKPVVIERITLSKKRRDVGKVRATVVVTTYSREVKG